MAATKIGDLLIERHALEADDLRKALQAQVIVGGKLGTNLLELGYVGEDVLLDTLAKQLRAKPAKQLDLLDIPATVLRLVSEKVAARYKVIPFRAAEKTIHLAMTDVSDLLVQDEVAFLTAHRVQPYVALEIRILEALERHYSVKRPRRYVMIAGRLAKEIKKQRAALLPPPPPGSLPDIPPENIPVRRVHPAARDLDLAEVGRRQFEEYRMLGPEARAVEGPQEWKPPEERVELPTRSKPSSFVSSAPTHEAAEAVPLEVPSDGVLGGWGNPWEEEDALELEPALAAPALPISVVAPPPPPPPAAVEPELPPVALPPPQARPREIEVDANEMAQLAGGAVQADLPELLPPPLSPFARRQAEEAPAPPSAAVPEAAVPPAPEPAAPALESETAAPPPVKDRPPVEAAPPVEEAPVEEYEMLAAARAALERAAELAEAEAEAAQRDEEAGIAEHREEDREPEVIDLDEAGRRLALAETRDDISDVVLAFCSQYFSRMALFIPQKHQVLGWNGRGDGLTQEKVKRIAIALDGPSIFLNLLNTTTFYLGPLPQMPLNRELMLGLGDQYPRDILVVPILLRQKLVAFLYADRGAESVAGVNVMEIRRIAVKAAIALEVYILKNKLRLA